MWNHIFVFFILCRHTQRGGLGGGSLGPRPLDVCRQFSSEYLYAFIKCNIFYACALDDIVQLQATAGER